MGKSTFTASLIRRLQKNDPQLIVVYVFFQYADEKKSDPTTIIKSLAYQIAERFPSFQEQILKTAEELGVGSQAVSLWALLNRLLVEPLKCLESSQRVLIALDALDECGDEASANRKDMLKTLSPFILKLPDCVRLFVTSRPEHDILSM